MSYLFLTTADGSPTLRSQQTERGGEAMHSLLGAASETAYIYGHALDWILATKPGPVRLLSLGLGLGYIEAHAIGRASQMGRLGDLEIVSFELDSTLTLSHQLWLEDRSPMELNDELRALLQAYEDVYSHTAQLLIKGSAKGPTKAELKSLAASVRQAGRWTFRGAFDPRESHGLKERDELIDCWCFDAFSSKSDPHLWTEAFLTATLSEASASVACFATYACTGNLKRALRAAGFEIEIRPGFSGKRDSTFATRGI